MLFFELLETNIISSILFMANLVNLHWRIRELISEKCKIVMNRSCRTYCSSWFCLMLSSRCLHACLYFWLSPIFKSSAYVINWQCVCCLIIECYFQFWLIYKYWQLINTKCHFYFLQTLAFPVDTECWLDAIDEIWLIL